MKKRKWWKMYGFYDCFDPKFQEGIDYFLFSEKFSLILIIMLIVFFIFIFYKNKKK